MDKIIEENLFNTIICSKSFREDARKMGKTEEEIQSGALEIVRMDCIKGNWGIYK